jgi:hypothetical protein
VRPVAGDHSPLGRGFILRYCSLLISSPVSVATTKAAYLPIAGISVSKMKSLGISLLRFLIFLTTAALCGACCCVASGQAKQAANRPGAPPTSQPAKTLTATSAPATDLSTTKIREDAGPSAQQSGQGNLTGQVDAHGWTGIEYTTALPAGQLALMAMQMFLSHRREMERIKQNGKS